MSLAHLLSASLSPLPPSGPAGGARIEPLEILDHWHFKSYRRLPLECPVGFTFADFERERDGGAGRLTTYAFAGRDPRSLLPKFIEVGWDGIIPLDADDVWSARLETIAAAAWEASACIAGARASAGAKASGISAL